MDDDYEAVDNQGDDDTKRLQMIKIGVGLYIHHFIKYNLKEKCRTSSLSRYKWVIEVLHGHHNRRENLHFPHPLRGKYYLVDASYHQMKGHLRPYKGERYHLPDFRRGTQPSGRKEIFNHAHSSLRCTIERTFGV
ncbi:hypothetical protein Dsin_025226 [Dipteronia sinensis]|uniref:DDE Tnp4 domain-containing protein n=1 Tax=Dipteronia sinensis TaxID=43782 RepID=A0AAD9ZVL9_9ROSI|nr:hypothetical protein Dsin_025226 [Dipteronia sinensis]